MSEIFQRVRFSTLNINDPFFDTLKNDYPGFNKWFQKKQEQGAIANIITDNGHIAAFVYLKDNEVESIELNDSVLPAVSRVKIGTLKINDNIKGRRIGEGAIGIALWNWFRVSDEEIYVTVFPKHKSLIELLTKFGFQIVGKKKDTQEYVFIKDKEHLNYDSPYL